MTSFDNLSSTQKIRAALHRDVRAIATETCHFLGLEITKSAMEIVAELVYKKLSVYGTDLEAFAKHAKRANINTDDVKLLVRRCPSLKNHLNAIAPNTITPKEKRRKTVAGKLTEIAASKQKEPEISTTKQKKPEIPISKQTEQELLAPKQKDNQEEIEEKDNMVVDDMIDLTID